MDEKLIAYFKRVVKTIIAGLLWLAFNSSLGIMKGYAYIEDKVQTKHLLFYAFLLLTTTLLLWFVHRVWRKNLNIKL